MYRVKVNYRDAHIDIEADSSYKLKDALEETMRALDPVEYYLKEQATRALKGMDNA